MILGPQQQRDILQDRNINESLLGVDVNLPGTDASALLMTYRRIVLNRKTARALGNPFNWIQLAQYEVRIRDTRKHMKRVSEYDEIGRSPEADVVQLFRGAGGATAYLSELDGDREVLGALSLFERRFGAGWSACLDQAQAHLLYALIRAFKLQKIVETGVWHGFTTLFILEALGKNDSGKLYSIDLPPLDLMSVSLEPGWIIPEALRARWELSRGTSRKLLNPLLDYLGEIDLFMHDGEHTYASMRFEYESSWKHLKRGGFLLSHDINGNDAFLEFAEKHDSPLVVIPPPKEQELGYLGIIRKP